MKLSKIFKGAKKGSKAAAKLKGKGKGAAVPAYDWPAGTKIGVFGHDNAGKTVYFTVLNEECKISKNLQISITDNATANEILGNYRSIWGVQTETGSGTVVDMRGEKRFPEPTEGDRLLLFSAILDRSKKMSVVTYDYSGETVSINATDTQKEKTVDFMLNSDGLLFFFDPKVLAADLQTQSDVASFVSMLEMLAPLKRKVPLPIGLVITKADILPGFTGEDQSVLIGPDDEGFLAEDFDFFLERVLNSNRIASNSTWAGTVRNLLVKLREFLKVVVGRTLNFQIFFTSCTGPGQAMEKIGTDVGRSIYAPPERMRPVGVKEPFYWLLHAIRRHRRINRMRKLARYVALISIVWMLVYSIPFFIHSNFLYPKPQKVEDNILKAYDGNFYNTSDRERRDIITAYRHYEDNFIRKTFFPIFKAPAMRIKARYEKFDLKEALKQLDNSIAQFTAMVKDTSLWPKLNPSNDSLIQNKEHEVLVAALNGYHSGDETTVLYKRSGRVLNYWDLFTKAIGQPADTTFWATIRRQIQQDQNLYASDISGPEKGLGQALSARKVEKAKEVVAQKTAFEFDQVIDNVNGNLDPAYRLGKAVRDLNRIKEKLDPTLDARAIATINRYVRDVNEWKKKQTFNVKIQSLPDKDHIHIEVVPKGQSPTWSEFSQTFEGDEVTIRWKIGDEIHIAYDAHDFECVWGRNASDRKVFQDDYAIFGMEGDVTFTNVGKTITVSFTPGLIEQLPELK